MKGVEKIETKIESLSKGFNEINIEVLEALVLDNHTYKLQVKPSKMINYFKNTQIDIDKYSKLINWYYFCLKNPTVECNYVTLGDFAPFIKDWVIYTFFACQFEEECVNILTHSSEIRNLREKFIKSVQTEFYKIPKFPNSTFEENIKIFKDILENNIFKPDSPIRNFIILFGLHCGKHSKFNLYYDGEKQKEIDFEIYRKGYYKNWNSIKIGNEIDYKVENVEGFEIITKKV